MRRRRRAYHRPWMWHAGGAHGFGCFNECVGCGNALRLRGESRRAQGDRAGSARLGAASARGQAGNARSELARIGRHGRGDAPGAAGFPQQQGPRIQEGGESALARRLSRRDRCAAPCRRRRGCAAARAADAFLEQSFHRLLRAAGHSRLRRRLRARGDPAPPHRPFRRHAARVRCSRSGRTRRPANGRIAGSTRISRAR
jgi:hypothetical protein